MSPLVCMWNSAVCVGSHSAGGLIVKDSGGTVVAAKGLVFEGVVDPLVVETISLREALHCCQDLGIPQVRFEGDAKILIDKINAKDARDSRVGAIIKEILSLLRVHSGFCVRFVGRNSNRVAHSVARKTLSLSPASSRLYDFRAWVESRV
ncbi:unnamed protein product [Linum trigynum]|uniref:RNase H type-1 domain-containing protein n=1 Tax=Linum trigynum TaxID=586398 RepID=A0AAV2F0E8_9ROSI